MTQDSAGIEPRITLAVDAGSPVVSAALARDGELLAERHTRIRRSSLELVPMIDALLSEIGSCASDLGGILGLRGPGSFTGLRVGLATCLGLHQALGVPATTLTTFETLAAVSPERNLIVLAAVESIRHSWLVQTFRANEVPEPLDEPRTVPAEDLAAEMADLVIGFGVNNISLRGGRPFGTAILEPPPLAGQALMLWGRKQEQWDPSGLVRPLYLQALSATQPSTPAP
jgi:tRNA threonylcarbamoyl adenosine modification protein YeaZ